MKLRATASGQPRAGPQTLECSTEKYHGQHSGQGKGLANEAVGNIKQGVGKATDNDRLETEGKIQEKKGEAQQTLGKAKDALKKTIDKA